MLVAIASDDAYHLGVLSSQIHVLWALAAGGRLGIGNDPRYNKTRCFEPFPFPAATDAQVQKIRALGEALDAHRKTQQAAHPGLGLTDLYNVVEALRAGRPLTAKEQAVHAHGLASVLLDLHERLDRAVADAYGWPWPLAEADVLARLVALNAARRAEEERGHVRWLRPAYQSPEATAQTAIALPAAAAPAAASAPEPFPADLPAQILAVRRALADGPADAAAVAARFKGVGPARVRELLDTLAALGQVRAVGTAYAG